MDRSHPVELLIQAELVHPCKGFMNEYLMENVNILIPFILIYLFFCNCTSCACNLWILLNVVATITMKSLCNLSFVQAITEWHFIDNSPQMGYLIIFVNIGSTFKISYFNWIKLLFKNDYEDWIDPVETFLIFYVLYRYFFGNNAKIS